jgi:hypothetical protein
MAADTRQPVADNILALANVPVSRRRFLSVGLAGIVSIPLLWSAGCGSSQDGDGDNNKKKKKNGGGGGGGGY